MKISLKEFFDRSTVITLLICIILISLIGGGSLAYRNKSGITENKITSGEIKVDLINIQEDGTEMPECIYSILPSQKVPNTVKAKNICNNSEYIRIKLNSVVKNEFNEDLSMDPITFNFNEKYWTYKDGYYYYYKALKPKEDSLHLYDIISFGNEIDNSYKKATLTIDITLEAVQSANNGATVFDAQGWEVVDNA